jgi:uroporphyrinogen III methyltransferase/synthase
MTTAGKRGLVYLVGAGPGDPGLLTIKGMECLQKADVVIYDYLSDPALLVYAPDRAEKLYVGKQSGQHTLRQEEINNLLVKKALEGRIVVRLKGGDPFVFGRGGEECEALLNAGILYEIVPGITSGIAAPAYAGIPVTHRKVASSVAFITGNEDPTKPSTNIHWEHLAHGVDTLVFYMGVANLGAITAELMKHGRSPLTPVAVIRWGTKAAQETIVGTLETIVELVTQAGIRPPAITIVGEVVSLRPTLKWFENRPLFGKRIINTRSRSQASALTRRLIDLGADVSELPTIDIDPVGENSDLAKELAAIDKFAWAIFTSPNAVDIFFKLFIKIQGDIRNLGKVRIASIGPGTTLAIEKYRVKAEITAKESVAEGLLQSLKSIPSWKNVSVLLPRASEARDILPDTLSSWGAVVKVAPAYTTIKPRNPDREITDKILNGEYDCITFSSSSTFENFVALFTEEEFSRISSSLKAVSIGPVTSSTIKRHGISPVMEASVHTIPGLVAAIEEYFKI